MIACRYFKIRSEGIIWRIGFAIGAISVCFLRGRIRHDFCILPGSNEMFFIALLCEVDNLPRPFSAFDGTLSC